MLCRLTSRLSVCFWILVNGNHATHSLHQASTQKKKWARRTPRRTTGKAMKIGEGFSFRPILRLSSPPGTSWHILLFQHLMLRRFRKCQILSVIAVTARSTSFGYGCNSIMDPKTAPNTQTFEDSEAVSIRLNSGGWKGRPLTFGWSTTDGEPDLPGRVSIDDSINLVATGLLLQAFSCFHPLRS